MKIKFLTIAQQELDDAVAWYNRQTEDLGREFLDELDRTVRRFLVSRCLTEKLLVEFDVV